MTKVAPGEGLTYKGKPLVRHGNIIYYGTMAEKYVVMMQVLESEKVKDVDLATKVSVQLQLTSPEVKPLERAVKRSEKRGLYDAVDLAEVWLARALSSG